MSDTMFNKALISNLPSILDIVYILRAMLFNRSKFFDRRNLRTIHIMWNVTKGVDSIDAIYVNDETLLTIEIFKCLKYFDNFKKDYKTIDIFLEQNQCFCYGLKLQEYVCNKGLNFFKAYIVLGLYTLC